MAAAPSTRDLAEQLRSAGAWLYLAADDLDGGLAQATKKAGARHAHIPSACRWRFAT